TRARSNIRAQAREAGTGHPTAPCTAPPVRVFFPIVPTSPVRVSEKARQFAGSDHEGGHEDSPRERLNGSASTASSGGPGALPRVASRPHHAILEVRQP